MSGRWTDVRGFRGEDAAALRLWRGFGLALHSVEHVSIDLATAQLSHSVSHGRHFPCVLRESRRLLVLLVYTRGAARMRRLND